MLRQMHVQVCTMYSMSVLGAVIKHKKKCKEAVNASDHASICVWNPHLYDALVSVVVLTSQVWFCDTLWKSTVLQVYN